MKKLSLLLLTSTLAIGLSISHAYADLTIANNGKSTFTIVIPAQAPSSVTDAAQELKKDIAESTNANLSIQPDNENVNEPIISLGSTAQAKKAGITLDNIADSAFRIITRGGNLYIIGFDTVAEVNTKSRDQITPRPNIPDEQYTKDGGWSNGTANGVYTFLEDYLGMRWLMPGKLGRDVPRKSTFTIPEINRTETPAFIYRDLYLLQRYDAAFPAVGQWKTQQKLGFSYRINYEHNWAEAVPRSLFKTKPEWFAMINGKRVLPDSYVKLETTNKDLIRYYADKAIAALKADPHMNSYSLSPSDGRNWSESPESKALYDPSPSTLFDPEATPGPPSTTPLVLKWYHDVSALVAKEYPQGKLAGYIYADYLYPPKGGSMTLPDNFTPVIAPSFDYGYRLYRKDVQKQFDYVMGNWSKVAPPVWFYYDLPNQILSRYAAGMITPPGTSILNFVFPRLGKYNISGTRFYGNSSWSSSALANYIDAKMLWDPSLDANAIQHDWLMRAYGPQAGAKMEVFYKNLDRWFFEFYNYFDSSSYHATERLFKELYAPHYQAMEKLFLQAKAEPMTEAQQQRFQLLEDNMIVLQWRLRAAGYLSENVKSPLQRSGAEVANLMFDKGDRRLTKDEAFDIFPILWQLNRPERTPIKIALNQTPPQTKATSVPNVGYILLYAAKDGTVNIHTDDVDSGSAFVGYRIYEYQKDGTSSASLETRHHDAWYAKTQKGEMINLLQQGLFYNNETISFQAKAGALYYLHITPQGFMNPKLDYKLTIPGAVMATGSYHENTLYLQGKPAAFYVHVPTGFDLSTFSDEQGVSLSTQSPADTARAAELRKYTESKILMKLDDKWLFNTDPDKVGLQQGVNNANYDDRTWKTVTALDHWQNQGFTDYKGVVWYRKAVTIPQVKSGRRLVLFFGAIDGDAVVYINGKKAGDHSIGADGGRWDQPFALDVTDAVQAGDNTFAVQVTKTTFVGGMYKGAALIEAAAQK